MKSKYTIGDKFEYVGYNVYDLGLVVEVYKIDKYPSMNVIYLKGDNKEICMNETEWDKMIRYSYKAIRNDLTHERKR